MTGWPSSAQGCWLDRGLAPGGWVSTVAHGASSSDNRTSHGWDPRTPTAVIYPIHGQDQPTERGRVESLMSTGADVAGSFFLSETDCDNKHGGDANKVL